MLFEVDVVLRRHDEGEQVKGRFTEVVDSLLESFVALAVFKGRCMSQLGSVAVDSFTRGLEVGFGVTEEVSQGMRFALILTFNI